MPSRLPIAGYLTSTGSGVLNLSLLDAGVASSGGIGAGSGPSVGGQRPRNNNFTVEGVDNNSLVRDRSTHHHSERRGGQLHRVAEPVLGGIRSLFGRPVQPDHQERHQPVPRHALTSTSRTAT